jgi:N-methylhydantoinase A/oxoprolinase/acetone carboxylase beta subunit
MPREEGPHAAPGPDSATSQARYLIGVDTGGTYTDAAVLEARGHRVLASAKALTTKGDLAIGVMEALQAALAQLPQRITPHAIAMVSVSTTLATNAVVEGHGSASGVVLIGFDAAMVERSGIAKAFPEIPIALVAGGHQHNGEAVCPLDLDALHAALDHMDAQVQAYAVAGAFAVRNGEHEQAARALIVQRTGKPVTLSTELSCALDAPRRALTAVLNARLIPRIAGLIEAVQRAMATLGMQCPLMVVKGDGSLALAESVATRPIETLLSGPAASLVGAQWLSGLDSFILADMGGTTTDLGLLVAGRPQIREEGAEVGGWRTMVRAIDVRTIGLGGDSEVRLLADGKIQLGPQRVTPVSLIASRYPEVLELLRADLDDVHGGSAQHGQFVLLPFATDSRQSATGLSPREQEALQRVTHAPQPLRTLARSLNAQRALASLQARGLVQLCRLTPSDVSHVLGLQANWSQEAATLATQLACRLRDMQRPSAERTRAFAQDVWDETVRLSALAVLQSAFGVALADNPLTHAVCSGQGRLGLASVSLKPSIPVVAVGGPVGVYYPEVQRRLGCDVRFPPFCEVANAVGAASGVVAHSVSVQVLGDGSGEFRLHAPSGTRVFDNAPEALQAALVLAEQLARDAVRAMGAAQPQVQLSTQKQYLPGAQDESRLLQAHITAEALGRPNAAA